MKEYLDLMQKTLDEGVSRPDRTGTGTKSIFGQQLSFYLPKGFPAVTTKKLAWKACVSELLWFIEGSGDERRLREILHGDRNTVKGTIWTQNAEASYWKPKAKFEGDLGRVYGQQWRKFPKPPKTIWQRIKQVFTGPEYVDQLTDLIEGLKKDPYGRRHVLTAWNPGELDNMALPPCHMFAQFFVAPMNDQELHDAYFAKRSSLSMEERLAFDIDSTGASREGRKKTPQDMIEVGLPTHKLSCQMYQRSVDEFLGLPFNIASYSLFTHMIAQVCGLSVGDFVWVGGDCHVYDNHVDAAKEQLAREPFPLPTLWLNPDVKNIEDFTMDDIKLYNYQSHDVIKAPMAV